MNSQINMFWGSRQVPAMIALAILARLTTKFTFHIYIYIYIYIYICVWINRK